MNHGIKRFVVSSFFGLLVYVAAAQAANVDLTLYNTVAMLSSDNSPLTGNSATGCLVQLIRVGPNGVIDPASTNSPGLPSGDDTLVSAANNPTHVGAGLASSNIGKLVQSGMIYDSTNVGAQVYVRYWNAENVSLSAQYGDSAILLLPAADGFGQAELDFLPTGSPTPITSHSIPTLSEWGMLCLFAIIVYLGGRKLLHANNAVAVSPGQHPLT